MENSLDNYNSILNIINDRKIENVDIYKEKISYFTVQNSFFSKSTFKNCDIVGCKFYNCSFNNIQLNYADIISLWITNCIFVNVCFDGTCIDDIDFQNCVFKNCSFNNFTMKNCRFLKCKFYAFKPSCCLCELNYYMDSSFTDSIFSSSFHYQIFSNCKFDNTTTDLELLGYNYGLLSNNQITVERQNTGSIIPEIEPSRLYKKYIKQNLYVNALILRINYEYNDDQTIILLWAEFLEAMIKNNIIIKSNEILFVKNLISFFSNNNNIAPILLFELNNKLINIINHYPVNNQKTKDDIILLINNLYFEFKKHTQMFLDTISDPIQTSQKVIIEIKYLEKPKMDLSHILNQFGMGKCHQVKTAKGSFLEWISCPNSIISCLEILLMLLDVTVPIVYDSLKAKKNSNKNNRTDVLDLSKNDITDIKVNVIINNGCQILNGCNFVENNFYGYNNKNVQTIKISAEK